MDNNVTDTQAKMAARWKPKLFYALAVALCIIIALFLLFRLHLKSQLQARLRVISAEGYPVSCEELDQWYGIPEGAENGAYVIMKAFAHFTQWTGKQEDLPIAASGELPGRTEPLSDKTRTAIDTYLEDNRQALEILHEAADIEHCRYPVDFSAGLDLLLPHLNDVKTGVKLLGLETITHAANKQPELAVRSMESAFALARSVEKEPLLISQLVRLACLNLNVQFIERVISRADLTEEQLSRLGLELQNAQDLSAISRGFVGELCQGIYVFKNPQAQGQLLQLVGRPSLPFPVLVAYRAVGLAESDAVAYVDLMYDYIKTNQLPISERQRATRALGDAIESKIAETSRIHILLCTVMPPLARVTQRDLRAIAHLHTAQVGLAVERYRLKNGRLPESLAELVPAYLDAVPKDPFDGRDIRYKKLDVGFVVYSIGEDQSDDGGREKPPRREKDKGGSYDITFVIER